MNPAIEITLHLDRVYAAQRRRLVALEPAFRDCTWGTNLLPMTQRLCCFRRSEDQGRLER
jgi:hypothetical protein